MSSVCAQPHDSRSGNGDNCSLGCFESSKALAVGFVARSEGECCRGQAGHAAAELSTAFRNWHVSREFMAFRGPSK